MGEFYHLDLFSGIGGFGLAAQWAGYTTVGFVEIDPFCQRVLKKHWPEVLIHDDIRTFTSDLVGRPIDLLTGGFPCQPFSVAGKRLGKEDDRALWPEMLRVIHDVRPRWVLGENVAGHISMGLDGVLADLEEIGYSCWPVVVPACAVNAPHRRDRVWIMAHAERGGRREQLRTDAAQEPLPASIGREGAPWIGPSGEALADAEGVREREPADEADAVPTGGNARSVTGGGSGREAIGKVGRGIDGIPTGIHRRVTFGADWEDGIPRTTVHEPNRTNRLKALGNAIVPAVAYQIIQSMHGAFPQ